MDNTPRAASRAAVARESASHARREALSSAAAANISLVAQAAFPDAQTGVPQAAAGYAGAAASYTVEQLQGALPPSSMMIQLVVVQRLNTRRPLGNPNFKSEMSNLSCVGKQQVLGIICASSDVRLEFKENVLVNSCGCAVIDLGDADDLRALCLKQMQLLIHQAEEDELDDAGSTTLTPHTVTTPHTSHPSSYSLPASTPQSSCRRYPCAQPSCLNR